MQTIKNMSTPKATLLALVVLAASFAFAFTAYGAGPAPVNLLSASNFVILSKAGITNTGSHTSAITGNIGASPITAAAMNNVFCSEINGTIYGVDAAYTGSGATTCFAGNPPLSNKTLVDNAVADMVTAYNDAAGRTPGVGPNLNVGGGTVSGQNFAPGTYTWGTNVNITGDITLTGTASDVWIFQVSGTLNLSNAKKIILSGGAQPSNIFWQVTGATTLGTTSTFEGNILDQTNIVLQTGAVLHGRALAQTAVTLDASTVSAPTTSGSCPAVTQTMVSDTANNTVAQGGSPAVSVTPSPAWTATIPGATTWIWETGPTSANEVVAFTRSFTVSGTVLSAQLDIAADNSYKVFIDGVQVAADAALNNFQTATQDTYNLTANVTPGTHTLRIEVTNSGTFDATSNPAGLLYKFTIVTCPSPPPPPPTACSSATAPAGYILRSGTPGSDVVTLSANTMFVGNGGNDKVTAGNGDYIICTAGGNDQITTGNGNVTIDAGGGNNKVTTGNGNGTILTGAGNDDITTGTGDHTINAGSGNNLILTGDGTQNVTTAGGNDKITTGSGNDTINAGSGNNNVKSGGGTDTVTTGGGNDLIDGGAGVDSCSAGGGTNSVSNCP